MAGRSGMLKDFSISALVAGFVSVLVGFTSSVAIIFQATQNLHATPEQTASWLWAIGIGMGVPTILLSLATRKPILIAWSTPGAVVIGAAAAAGHLTMSQAIGCFLFNGVLIIIAGFSGGFEKVMNRLPLPLASALLAGVLSRFALDAFTAIPRNPSLVLPMIAAYVLGRRFWPKANVPLILLLGIAIAALQGQFHMERVPWQFTLPVWMAPEFSPAALVGVGIPLFIVTMASQNLPGIAAIRVGGYEAPVSRIIGVTGIATFLLAPFGAFGINLAAITAAFVVGPEAHPDPKRRYWAPVCAGFFYLLVGVFGATVAGLFAAFPRELVLAVGGLALLATIGNALSSALAGDRFREASIMTFFVTLSGVTLLGIGSAFWGIVAGAIVLAMRRRN
jgi:benzoate membrane transport protein